MKAVAVTMMAVAVALAAHGSLTREPLWGPSATDTERIVGAVEMLLASAVFVAAPLTVYIRNRHRSWLWFAIGAALLAVYFLLHEFLGIGPP